MDQTTTPSNSVPSGMTIGLYFTLAGMRRMTQDFRSKYLRVTSPSMEAMTISRFFGDNDLSTTTISPSIIPASSILSHLTRTRKVDEG